VLGELADNALTLVEIPALAISSTDCRRRAEQRRPLWYLMPDGVVQYVKKRRLYRNTKDTAHPTESRLATGNNT
jgi:nicotinate-nucleotide adenylyltransferase